MIGRYLNGLGHIASGFPLLFQKGIRPFVIMPVLINILVFSLGIWYGIKQFQGLMDILTAWLPDWLDWLQWLLWPFFALLILIGVFYSFTLIANLIAAPFNSLLAERLEQKLTGKAVGEFQGYRAIFGTIIKTVSSEIRKILYMLKWVIPLLILSILPVINFIAPIAWGIFSAWMLALEYSDYPMGNHNLFFKQELSLLRQHRYESLGLGSGIMLMTSIPIVNFFAMPTGVAAATVYWVKRLSLSHQSSRHS